jgi:hypothetical protein
MPEIMSAENLFSLIRPYRPIGVPKWNIADPPSALECVEAIEARDSAMLEKYKEAIVCQWAGMKKGEPNDAMVDAKLQSIIFALDSAFVEIEGWK